MTQMIVAPLEPVSLILDGGALEGWTEIRISRALDHAAGDFSLGLTDKSRGPDGVTVPARLYCGAPCQIAISGEVVLTGYVDDVAVSYTATSHTIRVSGRSKTADLVDCSVDPSYSGVASGGGSSSARTEKPLSGLFDARGEIYRNTHGIKGSPTAGLATQSKPVEQAPASASGGHFRGQRLAQVAQALARPYGVTVLVTGDSGDPLPAVTVEKGDKVFDVIERLCRLRGLLASDDAGGNLILARPGGGRPQGTLELGRTILAGDASFSVKERYSEIRVFGQSPALHRDAYGRTSDDDELDGDPDDDDGDGPTANGSAVDPSEHADIAARAASVATAQGVARDAGVPRYRLLVVQAETAAEAGGVQGRAEWEIAHRLGKSISLTYTVPGWRSETGALWETNGSVWLRDSLAALDRSLVVGGLEFSLDGQGGMVTKLALAPQESFEPEPLKAKKPKSGGGRGSDGKAAGKSESQGLFAPRGEISTSVRG